MEALRYIKHIAGGFQPKTAIVLGSGLGQVTEMLDDPVIFDAQDIPHWPISTAPGHAGKVALGKLGGRAVVVLKGRLHYYEGHSMDKVTFPIRVMGMWGAEQYIGTNASGGIDPFLKPGDIVLVNDHINNMGTNPLIGPVELRWNVRFPDMTYAYSRRLIKMCDKVATSLGVQTTRGVYVAFSGPSFETPAEIRMARAMGASVVGMSTVPEVIVANAMGMETAVISCVSNLAAGLSDEILSEEDVLLVMQATSERLGKLICGLMRELESESCNGKAS